jgi:hypothetical protein
MTATPAALAIGERAYHTLSQCVALRWFNAAPRVQRWRGTLVNAYAALADGEPDLQIPLPEDVTVGEDARDTDSAGAILDNWEDILGHGVVMEAFDAAYGPADVELDFGLSVDQGIALAYRYGW